MSDKKTVDLVHPVMGVRGFSVEHAERLMKVKKNGGWEYHKEEKKPKTSVKKKEQKEE